MRIQSLMGGIAFASMAAATLGCSADNGIVSTEPVDVAGQGVDVAVSADATTGLVDTMPSDAAYTDTSSSDEAQADIATPPDAGGSSRDEPDTSPEDDGFGAPCDDGDDCPSGICLEHMGEEVCTTLCDTDCPPGWSCEQVAFQGEEAVDVCVSSFEHLCRPCMTESDCSSGTSVAACVDYGGPGMFCGATCDDDMDCPEGFVCQESASSRDGASRQCVDMDGVCECSTMASELELSTSCSISNEAGQCDGLRTCGPEGLSACSAETPSVEVCNGLDDDCDGVTDGMDCDDTNPCTTDSCLGAEGCRHEVNIGAACDDGEMSTSGDTCTAEASCVGEPIVCPDHPCILEASPNGTDCDLTYAPQGVSCDDGDVSTKDDLCDGQGGCMGTPYTCEADPCTASSTPNGVDCTLVYQDAGFECDDGEASTKGDVCDGQGGCAGTSYTCEADACTASSTPNGADCTLVYQDAGFECDDGEASTKGDVCDGEGGCKGTSYTCEANPCMVSSTPNGVDCTVVYQDAGFECDDGDPSTVGDGCDGSGGCKGTPTVCGDDLTEGLESCDDGNIQTEACAYGEESCTVCSATCELIAGAVTGYCGDGVIQAEQGESCDDDNATDGDGCSSLCQDEFIPVCEVSVTFPASFDTPLNTFNTKCQKFTAPEPGVYRIIYDNPDLSDTYGSAAYVAEPETWRPLFALGAGFYDGGMTFSSSVTTPKYQDKVYVNANPEDGVVLWRIQFSGCSVCTGTDTIRVDFIPKRRLSLEDASYVGTTSHTDPNDFDTLLTAGTAVVEAGELLFTNIDTCGNGGGAADVFRDTTAQGFAIASNGWPKFCNSESRFYAREVEPGEFSIRTRMADWDCCNNTGTRTTSFYVGHLQ